MSIFFTLRLRAMSQCQRIMLLQKWKKKGLLAAIKVSVFHKNLDYDFQ